jgi:TonB family protein
MFDVLPASASHHDIRPRWVTASMVAHALALALALMATRGALEATKVRARDETMLLFVPRSLDPVPAAPVPDIVVPEPPPEGFQTIPTPAEISSTIPPIDLDQRPLDPRDFAGIGREGGVAGGDSSGVVADPDAIYQATTRLEGFEPAILLAQPTPKYPAALLSAGLAGVVLVEFVIDTAGRVEAGSIRMIESSHRAFEDAAREAVLGASFEPARLGRQRVRQITQQRVRFVSGN